MKKVLAIFFAVLLLVANSGVAVATHFCAGKAIKTSISLGQNDLSCGMTNSFVECKNASQSPILHSKDCCANKYLEWQVENEFNKSIEFERLAVPEFGILPFFGSKTVKSQDNSKCFWYCEYSPPFLDLDIPVLVQSFLI